MLTDNQIVVSEFLFAQKIHGSILWIADCEP